MPKHYDFEEVKRALPEYSFQRHIDSGGFKDVFLVEGGSDNAVVKLLPIERASKKRRANNEADAMQKISSPNFVNLLDYFEAEVGGTSTFVMEEELIDGPTLRKVLDRGDHGLDLGIRVADVLLDLLIEFEDIGIYHRDIKPSNIMFNESGEVVLLDVGIVRFEERESVTPDHQDRLGTPNYGAPEQLDYDNDLQSCRIDIFSTGVVVFETITGIHPYSNTGKSISESIMEGDKIDFEGLLDDDELSEEINTLFDTMTQTKPYNRYRKPQFAREKLDEIMELMENA